MLDYESLSQREREIFEEAGNLTDEPLARVIDMLDIEQQLLDQREAALREQGYGIDEITAMVGEEANLEAREEVEAAAREAIEYSRAYSRAARAGNRPPAEHLSGRSQRILEAAGISTPFAT